MWEKYRSERARLLTSEMRKGIPLLGGKGETRKEGCKAGYLLGEGTGSCSLSLERKPWGRWRIVRRFCDIQVQRGPGHYLLADLHHWRGSKTLEKKWLQEMSRWMELPTEFPVPNEV